MNTPIRFAAIFSTFISIGATACPAAAEVLRVDYEGFTVWLDCDRRGAVRFEYIAAKDTGVEPRSSTFRKDPGVPPRCQQTSTSSYKTNATQVKYQRGHLVPANHFDHSPTAIKETNYITNILPQVGVMNTGAWEQTEKIIECYRDLEPLHVVGGVIWGNNTSDDYFVESHGVATPDAFWKVVVGRHRVIAWIVPNSETATRGRIDEYLVTVSDLEAATGETLQIKTEWRGAKPEKSWPLPYGCDLK